jgi:hypothetical protein
MVGCVESSRVVRPNASRLQSFFFFYDAYEYLEKIGEE